MPTSAIRFRLAAGALLGALVLASCTSAPATPAPSPTAPASSVAGQVQLAGTSWLLVGYTSPGSGGRSFTVPMSVTPTLAFGDGTAEGTAGCNTFSGSWTVDGDAIEFAGPVTSTQVACPDPGGQVEAAYLANLALVDRVVMQGANLVMTQSDGFATLEFMPAAAP